MDKLFNTGIYPIFEQINSSSLEYPFLNKYLKAAPTTLSDF